MRGAVTAYIRVTANRMDEAIRVLTAGGYIAERDDGDPDRPAGTVDLYVERHYGMINPDSRIRQQLVDGVTDVLDAARISYEPRAAGVVRGGEYPRSQELAIVDATTLKPTSFRIRARSAREADEQLARVAESLGCPVTAMTVRTPGSWTPARAWPDASRPVRGRAASR